MIRYDVIIVGASFAGLAVASKLKGKVLLIDRADIGTYQISACATPYDIIKELKCEDSVFQICDTFSLHINMKRIDFHFEKPYCTFDFTKFCNQLHLKNKACFLKANVVRVEKNDLFTVYTSKGDFLSKCLVDATGWRASIAEMLKPGYVHKNMLSFGIETEVPYRCKNFHFFYDPAFIKDGICWLFPCGEFSRFGIASYVGITKLIEKLDAFLERFQLRRRKVHGGFFCYCLKSPIVDNVFVVGCAQGQTLPLTGEGIRRCITYGTKCGEIIQNILDGKIALTEGLVKYKRLALKVKNDYDFLLKAQNKFLKMSEKKIEIVARIISNRLIFPFLERYYRKI
jgi:flavin-dependent dehydrogenase